MPTGNRVVSGPAATAGPAVDEAAPAWVAVDVRFVARAVWPADECPDVAVCLPAEVGVAPPPVPVWWVEPAAGLVLVGDEVGDVGAVTVTVADSAAMVVGEVAPLGVAVSWALTVIFSPAGADAGIVMSARTCGAGSAAGRDAIVQVSSEQAAEPADATVTEAAGVALLVAVTVTVPCRPVSLDQAANATVTVPHGFAEAVVGVAFNETVAGDPAADVDPAGDALPVAEEVPLGVAVPLAATSAVAVADPDPVAVPPAAHVVVRGGGASEAPAALPVTAAEDSSSSPAPTPSAAAPGRGARTDARAPPVRRRSRRAVADISAPNHVGASRSVPPRDPHLVREPAQRQFEWQSDRSPRFGYQDVTGSHWTPRSPPGATPNRTNVGTDPCHD